MAQIREIRRERLRRYIPGQPKFTIACLSGRRYRLHAYLSEDYLAGTGVQSLPLDVGAGSVGRPLTLVLSKPGIFLSQLPAAPAK